MNKNKKGPNISGHFMKINTETCIILGGGTSMVSPIEHINRISPYACIVFYSIMFNCDKNNVCKLDINGLCLYIAKIKKKFHIDESLFCLLNMKRYIDILVNIELPRCRASRILYVYKSPINYKELEFTNLPLALF